MNQMEKKEFFFTVITELPISSRNDAVEIPGVFHGSMEIGKYIK
jgi:hypothetical protein